MDNGKDREEVEKQLGRKPRGEFKVLKRTLENQPVVIKTDPILPGGKPFPTLYYLTLPKLVQAVSRLEDKGFVTDFEERIRCDSSFAKLYRKAQEAYINDRIEATGSRLEGLSPEIKQTITSTGIGGVKNLSAVKCLHAQYAHYLATMKNPVGEEISLRISPEYNR